VCDERRVFSVGDDDTANGGGGAIGMEGVGFLFNVLSDARPSTLGDCFGEYRHEFAIAVSGEAREGGEILLNGKLCGRLWIVTEYSDVVDLHGGGEPLGVAVVDHSVGQNVRRCLDPVRTEIVVNK